MTKRICAKSQEGRKTTRLAGPPGGDGSGRHGQGLAIVQETAGDPCDGHTVRGAQLLSPHQDSVTVKQFQSSLDSGEPEPVLS